VKRAGVAALLLLGACATGESIDEPSTAASTGTGTTLDCDGKADCDGTCVDLQTDPDNCGMCGRTCVLPNGVAACSGGDCALESCELGFANCDATVDNGCELAVDCTEGGACMTQCGSTGLLECRDPCTPSCGLPAESCNAIDDDCDGACDQGAIAGCRIAVHRAYNGTNGHLFTANLSDAMSWGLEAQNYFYLYAAAAADLRPFFRCPKSGTGNYLNTDSTDCEGTMMAPLATIGFIAPEPMMMGTPPTCGATPLYRLWHSGNNWHFYTTSAAERDAAVAAGWASQSIAGYVWLAP
jgi:hypothetical protein